MEQYHCIYHATEGKRLTMWVFYVAFIGLAVYFISQLPKEWRNLKHPSYILTAFTVIGFSSLMLLITCFYRIPNGWFRQAVLYCESVYFSLLAFTIAICLFRQLSYYPLRHFAGSGIVRIFADKRLFMTIVLVCTMLFCVVGFYNMECLQITPYRISIDRPCDDARLRVILLSDLHVGAGASYAQLDRMVEETNKAQPDLVVLAGDIADSSSSKEDLDYLFSSLDKIQSRWGIFYAEGNHEEQCHFDLQTWINSSSVVFLHDSAVTLPNGLSLLGRCDNRKVPVSQIRQDCGIGPDTPCIVIQHRPSALQALEGTTDLVLCGHTHGYQFPMCAMFFPVLYQPIEGWASYGSIQAITTDGVGAWGFHCSWPSPREITQIDITFTGGDHHEA